MASNITRVEYLYNLYFQSDDDSADQDYAVSELGNLLENVDVIWEATA